MDRLRESLDEKYRDHVRSPVQRDEELAWALAVEE
jgi:hypothetical protein